MYLLALLAILTGITLGAGIMVAKALDQTHRDQYRKVYRLSFPADLDAARINAWLRSISGTLRYSGTRLSGVPTVTFELWATATGIDHYLRVPWQHADYIVAQLRSLVPGIRVTPADGTPHVDFTRAVELGLTNTSRSLRIYDQADTAATLLASVQPLEPDEAIVMQWVATPAVPVTKPIHNQAPSHHVSLRHLSEGNLATRDEVNDRREKLEEPNFQSVLRVGAYAKTEARADHLLFRVRSGFASTRSATVRLYKRMVTANALQRRIDTAAGPLIFPMQVSSAELTALIGWPINNPFVVGLPPTMARHIPVTQAIPHEGRVIGRSNFPGNERKIAIPYLNALKHLHVAGPTGVGKTVLLGNLMRQDIAEGHGVVLIENKGDLFHTALDYVPERRLQDVVVLDVEDTAWPVGFNILQQGDPRVVVDEITLLFEHLYETKSVWTKEVLYHGLHTIVSNPELTFVDLAALLVPMTDAEVRWRDALIRNLPDHELRNFWQRFENQPRSSQDRIVAPVMDRIWQLNARPELRNIIGQSQSSFLMADVVAGRKILLVNLSGLARETASLIGTLLMNALWHAVKTTPHDAPIFLYLDEFQDFTSLPVDPEDMLAKARGFGLGMTLAHQHLAQLPKELLSAVQANTHSKIIFQTNANDAAAMAREFGASVEASDFQHLGQYEAIARVSTGTGMSAPFTLSTLEPAKRCGLATQVRSVSRKAHGRPAHEVARAIVQRRDVAKVPKTKRPPIGGSWGVSI